MKNLFRRRSRIGFRAQAMVEFAIVLPVLLVLLVGIMEVGRMIFMYAAVTNASREAARYGSAVGFESSGTYHKYKYCKGIANLAKNTSFAVGLNPATTANVDIRYDSGPNDPLYTDGHGPDNETEFNLLTRTCPYATSGDATVSIATNDRIVIKIKTSYTPVVKLIPIPARSFISISSRTIVGAVNVGP